MPKYSVSLESFRAIDIEAETPHAAVVAAEKRMITGWKATGVELHVGIDDPTDCHDVIAKCEGCSAPILDNDDYRYDSEDGIYLCGVCQLKS